MTPTFSRLWSCWVTDVARDGAWPMWNCWVNLLAQAPPLAEATEQPPYVEVYNNQIRSRTHRRDPAPRGRWVAGKWALKK